MQPLPVSFASGGTECRGWLYLPAGPGPFPAIALAHGYSATHCFHYWSTAEAFAEAGIAVLDFDGRRLGVSGGSPRQLVDVREQTEDLRNAVEFLRSHEEVDATRVGLYGSSFGGGLAIEVAAQDTQLAVLALIVPHVDGFTTLPGLPLKARLRTVREVVSDRVGRWRGREPRMVKVFGDPAVGDALIDRDHAWEALQEEFHPDGAWQDPWRRYVTEDDEYVNEVGALELLQLTFFRPGPKLKRVKAPSIVVIGDKDRVSPPGPQRKFARAAGAEIHEVPCDHFDAFRKAGYGDEALKPLINFVSEKLAVDAATPTSRLPQAS